MDLSARIDRRVTPSGGHRLWDGARDAAGVGQIRIGGKLTTVRRALWELAHGALPEMARINGCPDEPACVELAHLSLDMSAVSARRSSTRGRKGTGSLRAVRPGSWELRVTAGRWNDGRVRTLTRTVTADTETEAAALLRAFREEVGRSQLPADRTTRDLTVDQALDQFLTEHLTVEKGRAEKTVNDYRRLHRRWFSPTIGSMRLSRVDSATMDRLFGAMRAAGLSRSRLNQAKSLYQPFFRWAKRRGMTLRDPMAEFELPTSTQVSKERTPPEVGQLTLLLSTAVEVVPDVAPLLMLAAVTGMRRGELVGIRRSRVDWTRYKVTVDTAISESKKVKGTKTHRVRTFHVDPETVAMLARVCEQQDERARAEGIAMCADPFLFTLVADGAVSMSPDHVTERVAVLKGHLGIEDKRPGTVELEDEALRLRRSPARPRRPGKTGPDPGGGMSYREIALQLHRSERWVSLAVAAATRREQAAAAGLGKEVFDGSILGLRKFTSSELLDAGFNIGMVAQRQGHGPQVLARHYSKSRESSDRKAADHLGKVVHAPSGSARGRSAANSAD
ncbi:MAG: tyrosine-type recombinase/integrase [Acidimicrobiales bacterium]